MALYDGDIGAGGATGVGGAIETTIVSPVVEAVAVGDLAVFYDGVGLGKWKKPPHLQSALVNRLPPTGLEVSGAIRGSLTVINAVVSSKEVVTGLAGGSFAMAYVETGNGVKVGVYDAAGIGITTNITVDGAGTEPTSICALADGGFVVGYMNSTPVAAWRRYSSTGALVSTGTTVGNMAVSVAGLADGGWVVTSSNASALKFTRYDSAGVAQQTDAAVATLANNPVCTTCSSLYGGGFVIVAQLSSSQDVIAYRYNAAGALQGSAIAVGFATGITAVTGVLDGGFVILCSNTSGVPNIRRYSSAGVIQGAVISVGVTNGGFAAIAATPYGGFVATSSTGKTWRYGPTGVLLGGPIDFGGTGVSILADGGIILVNNGGGSTYAQFARYASAAVSVAGVYSGAAIAGASAVMETYGVQTLAVTYTSANFLHGGGINPGGNGAVFGPSAYLRGLA